jgi:SAM-dependent methyltransferase
VGLPMASLLTKSWIYVSRVTPKRGPGHALKVLCTPELSRRGVWRRPSYEIELLFWERQIVGGGYDAAGMALRLNPATQRHIMPKDVFPHLERYCRPGATVLDVGSGPVSLLSWGHNSGMYELTATDLLANEYRKLIELYGYGRCIQGINYVNCAGEELAAKLSGKSFDVVFCENALDHMKSPQSAFAQMSSLVKPGGALIIAGWTREATKNGGDGLHEHDLWLHNSRLWRAGLRGEDKIDLTAGLPLRCAFGKQPAQIDPHGRMLAVFEHTA